MSCRATVVRLRSYISVLEEVFVSRTKRALARGDDPEEVIQQIAQHRAQDKSDPQYYARLTVQKAHAEIERAQQHNPSPEPAESTHKEKQLDH